MTPVDAARLRAKATKASAGALRPAMVCSALDVLGLLDAHKLAREPYDEDSEEPCGYGDGCPDFGTRHGTCRPCAAREMIARLDALVTPEVTP